MFDKIRKRMDEISSSSAENLIGIIEKSLHENDRNIVYDSALYLLDFQKNYTRELVGKEKYLNEINDENITKTKSLNVWKKNTFTELIKFVKLSYAFDIKIRELNFDSLQNNDKSMYRALANNLRDTLLFIDKNHSIYAPIQKKNYEILNVLSQTEFNKKEDFKNIADLLMYTCQYYGCFFSPKSKLFKNLYSILYKLNKSISTSGLELNKIINFDRCCAIAVLEYKNRSVERMISFSGGWDISNVLPEHKSDLYNYFNEIIYNVLLYYKLGTTEVAKMNSEMVSFNINFLSYKLFEKCYLREVIKIKSKKIGCIKKHYSCVERKIMPYVSKKSKISKITFYVTKSPCSDCNLALNDIGTRINVVVNYESKYNGSKRICREKICMN